MAEQDFVQIQILRKSANWKIESYFLGDTVTFEAIDLTLSVEAIYDRVDNEDMRQFKHKQTSSAVVQDSLLKTVCSIKI